MTSSTPPPTSLDLAHGPGEPDNGSEGPGEAPARRHLAPWIAAGAAVGITALLAGGLALGGRGPLASMAGGSPDILKIGTPYGGTVDVIADGGGLRAGRYVLKGTLPSSPDTGTAWHLRGGSVDAGQVAALAAVLGVSGDPAQDGDGWIVRDGEAVLRVYDLPGIPFSYDASPDDGSCPSIPVDGYGGPDSAVGCVMTEPAPATTPLPGPDEATLGDLGRAFLAAFAADGSQQVWDGMPYGAVQVDPRVDGVLTSGLGASLQVSLDGVTAASGWLSGFVDTGLDRGDDYPLRSAKDVFASLGSLPEPAIACAEEADGTMCGGDVIVTGATYGLMLAFDDGTPVLVPAWLFTIDGSDLPMAQIAVQTRYLGEPSNLGGGGSGSGSGGSSTPGSAGTGTVVDPAPPAPPAPGDDPVVDPGTPTDSPTQPVSGPASTPGTVTWTGPRSLTLTVSGGCELETALASARTTATTIVVTFTFDTIACANDMGYVVPLPVTLDEDPAGRTVVDGTGTPIPVVEDAR